MVRNSYVPPTRVENATVASIVNVLCGVWLIMSPFVLGYFGQLAALCNTLACGGAIIVFAMVRASRPEAHAVLSWFNLLIGFWLMFSPFVLYPDTGTPVWNCLVVGGLVGSFALWSAASTAGMSAGNRSY